MSEDKIRPGKLYRMLWDFSRTFFSFDPGRPNNSGDYGVKIKHSEVVILLAADNDRTDDQPRGLVLFATLSGKTAITNYDFFAQQFAPLLPRGDKKT